MSEVKSYLLRPSSAPKVETPAIGSLFLYQLPGEEGLMATVEERLVALEEDLEALRAYLRHQIKPKANGDENKDLTEKVIDKTKRERKDG